MEKEKNERYLIIPKKFSDFVETKQMHAFLESILDYFKELFRLQAKQQGIAKEAKQIALPTPPLYLSEKKELLKKAKKMATHYAWILYNFKGYNDMQMDQNFFEVYIYIYIYFLIHI